VLIFASEYVISYHVTRHVVYNEALVTTRTETRMHVKTNRENTENKKPNMGGALVVWSRRLLATLESRMFDSRCGQ